MKGSKIKKPLVERGFWCCCPAEGPPAAKCHYLQLVGTYLVKMVPTAAEPIDCADAVVWAADAQAQSILPETVPAVANCIPEMNGVRASVLLPPNCGIAVVPSYEIVMIPVPVPTVIPVTYLV